MWMPRFACPDCGASLETDDVDVALQCRRCEVRFSRRGLIIDCLSAVRAASADTFASQYRTVRDHDGYRQHDPQYYRMLPCVPPTDPRAAEWRIRRGSYATLQRHTLRDAWQGAMHVADLGAGCGWLSHKLAALGHAVTAVDRLDDDVDGLGACQHYAVPFQAIRADFDALPFESGQFDLVVFNASLHYAPDPGVTLAEARRVLVPGGAIAVMDSPMFVADMDGQQMAEEEGRRFARECDVASPMRSGVGFLTFDGLARAAGRLGLSPTFTPTHGPWMWRIRRDVARFRLGRAPAAFGVWVAR